MPNTNIKKISCPIHGLIKFDMDCPVDSLAWDLLQAKEFQRLRWISQHGVGDLVYPGLSHSRFSHSIGCFDVARRIIRQVFGEKSLSKLPLRAQATAIASLLHDVGHGPLSHVFEDVLKNNGVNHHHENYTTAVLTVDTDITKIMQLAQGKKFLEHVKSFFSRSADKDLCNMVISSQIDADRMDYILRDKYMSGIEAGGFSPDWMIGCMEINSVQLKSGKNVEVLSLNQHGGFSIVEYLYARMTNYRLIASHQYIRSLRIMLSDLIQLTAEHLDNAEKKRLHVVDAIYPFLKAEEIDLDDFLQINDHTLWHTVMQLVYSKNKKIAELAKRITSRQIYKSFDITQLAMDAQRLQSLKSFLSENKLQSNIDDIHFCAYANTEDPFKKIYLKTEAFSSNLVEITESFEGISNLPKPFSLSRLIIKQESEVDKVRQFLNQSS